MDLKLSALIGATYLIPIAITLRRVYAPDFEIPAAMALMVARVDASGSRRIAAETRRAREMSGV